MSQSLMPADGDSGGFAEIEDAILQARDYVCPSSDLRPRTLEQARESDADNRSLRRFRAAVVIVALLVLVVVPAADRLGWLQGPATGPSQEEIHAAALKLAAESGMTSDWALLETFSQWRRSLAMRFDPRENNLR
ncbi:MAG: hypothetical protein ACO1RT_15220 [Planctomycetaceae bacterium]